MTFQSIGNTDFDVFMSKYHLKKIPIPMTFPPKRTGAVSTGSSTSDLLYFRRNITNSKLSCLTFSPAEDKTEGVRFNVISSEKQQPNSLRRDCAPILSLSSENPQDYSVGRHFLFDRRWGDSIYSSTHQHLKDEELFIKHTTLLPPIPSPRCSVNRKYLPFTKSCTLVSEDRWRLNAVTSDPISITTSPISPRGFSRNTRITSRLCNLSTLHSPFTTPDEPYADPVLGASTSFIRRLLEMSTLQEKTMRHERIIEFKKNRRHES